LALLSAAVTARGPGAAENQTPIACTLAVSDTAPLPLQPLGALLGLRNRGDTPVDVMHPSGDLWVRRTSDPPIAWHVYALLSLRGDIPPIARKRVLHPGGVFMEPAPLDYNGTCECPEPGLYEVKVRKDKWESAPVRVDVRVPEGVDAHAFTWLQKQDPRLGALFAERDWPVVPDVFVTPLEQLVERFPASRYADFARFGLAFAWVIGVEHYPNGGRTREQNLPKAEQLLTGLAAPDSPMQARAHYYLGIVAAKRGQASLARERYRKALTSKPDAYIEYLAGEALKGRPMTTLVP